MQPIPNPRRQSDGSRRGRIPIKSSGGCVSVLLLLLLVTSPGCANCPLSAYQVQRRRLQEPVNSVVPTPSYDRTKIGTVGLLHYRAPLVIHAPYEFALLGLPRPKLFLHPDLGFGVRHSCGARVLKDLRLALPRTLYLLIFSAVMPAPGFLLEDILELESLNDKTAGFLGDQDEDRVLVGEDEMDPRGRAERVLLWATDQRLEGQHLDGFLRKAGWQVLRLQAGVAGTQEAIEKASGQAQAVCVALSRITIYMSSVPRGLPIKRPPDHGGKVAICLYYELKGTLFDTKTGRSLLALSTYAASQTDDEIVWTEHKKRSDPTNPVYDEAWCYDQAEFRRVYERLLSKALSAIDLSQAGQSPK